MIRTRVYRKGVLQEKDFDPALVSDYLGEPGTTVWLDIEAPGVGDMDLLQEEFGLHPLAIEDATTSHQRPKVERYENHYFIAVYAVALRGKGSDAELVGSEVDIFVGDRFLITVRKDPVWTMDGVLERWDSGNPLVLDGVGFLLYVLLDTIVDEYFVVADALSEYIDSLEEQLFQQPEGTSVQRSLFATRKNLVSLRRVVHPLREVMNVLTRRDLLNFSDTITPYFQDVYDHVVRVSESIDGMRDLLTSALDVHLSVVSNRLNEIMKAVTSWAAIIGVATTIAGIYGMNFRLQPRENTLFGFWFAIGLMGVSTTILFMYFRKREWL